MVYHSFFFAECAMYTPNVGLAGEFDVDVMRRLSAWTHRSLLHSPI